MKKFARWIVAFTVAVFLMPLAVAPAQLPRDVRDMFEAMMGDLEPDLQEKFTTAIEENTATVNFTPEEFRRFRSNPINPFEGLDRIEAKDGEGTISLKFELPSIRNRIIGDNERQSHINLTQLKPIAKSVVPSVAAVFADDRQIALATVVDGSGHLVTKLSEVEDKKYLKLIDSHGDEFPCLVVHKDSEHDLAILKAETKQLSPIEWDSMLPQTGAFVLTPAPDASVVSLGTYSVAPRSTRSGQRALLGVDPDDVPGIGVKIAETKPGDAAFDAGMRNGDIVTRIASRTITDVPALVNAIREKNPGDMIEIEYVRNGETKTTQAILSSQNISGERAKRYKMMSRLGAIPSRRSDNFPNVFQHDGPIFPEQCGGPVIDLNGNVIGINIARSGRASTFAIPLAQVQSIVSEYLRHSVAAKQ
jgi:serine protease Do